MDRTAELRAACAAEDLFVWVDDLSRYPAWLDIVPRAVPAEQDRGDDGHPAWLVDLRGRVGPFARSKRLRMVRVEHDAPRSVRFERRELDGRHHSPWVLTARIDPVEVDACRLTVHLHYGGGLLGPLLERLLGDEIEASRDRLLSCVRTGG